MRLRERHAVRDGWNAHHILQNLRLHGYVFPTSEEIIFQGTYDTLSVCQLTWVYRVPRPKDRLSVHCGLVVERNSEVLAISGLAIFVRVPQAFPAGLSEQSLHPVTISEVHETHFVRFNHAVRDVIGVQTVESFSPGIIEQAHFRMIKTLFNDYVIHRI